MLFDEPGIIGYGGNSGFQAINLAVQFGVDKILLIGFDMHAANGVHWYGRNKWRNANNPLDHNYVRWRNALGKQSKVLHRMGVDVVNVSEQSALTCFRHAGIEQAMMDWKL